MNETEFNQLIDKTLIKIEEAIEQTGADIDAETGEGILTLIFENGSKIVINRQTPIQQLWLAGKYNGYHFNYVNNRWICDKSGKSLSQILQETITQQTDLDLNLNL